MGFFSWLTADMGRSICNKSSEYHTFTVHMHGLLPDGMRVRVLKYTCTEEAYEGTGEFGGKDYFELVSIMKPAECVGKYVQVVLLAASASPLMCAGIRTQLYHSSRKLKYETNLSTDGIDVHKFSLLGLDLNWFDFGGLFR